MRRLLRQANKELNSGQYFDINCLDCISIQQVCCQFTFYMHHTAEVLPALVSGCAMTTQLRPCFLASYKALSAALNIASQLR